MQYNSKHQGHLNAEECKSVEDMDTIYQTRIPNERGLTRALKLN